MTLVNELVTEMILLLTSSSPSPNVNTPTMLPHDISPLTQTSTSSQHPGGYPWQKDNTSPSSPPIRNVTPS